MRKHETAVCGTARTVVWEVGKCENRRQMPFMISIYLLPNVFHMDLSLGQRASLCLLNFFTRIDAVAAAPDGNIMSGTHKAVWKQ